MIKAVWIYFDIGVRGDYEGLYAWLDSKGAIECGDTLAFIKYEFRGDFITSLKEEIGNAVEITPKMRIYVIFRDTETGNARGKFIFGPRKAAPWTGYAAGPDQAADEEV